MIVSMSSDLSRRAESRFSLRQLNTFALRENAVLHDRHSGVRYGNSDLTRMEISADPY